jgi:tol-pal system protein YbgF
MRMKLFVPALLVLLTAGPAYPQNKDILQLQRDVIELKQIVNQIQKTIDQNDAAFKSLVEKMADQVNMLAGATQKINQAVDSLKTQDDTNGRDMHTALTTLNSTMKDIQDGMTSLQTQIGSVSREITAMKTTAEPLASANDLLRTAYVDYSQGHFDLAISGYQEFLSKFPGDARAAEAHFNIAESMSALKKFDQAIDEYDIVLQKFPDSDKSRAALLKKGYAQAETNPQAAIKTLNDVVKMFPGTSEATSAQTKIKELAPAARGRAPGK